LELENMSLMPKDPDERRLSQLAKKVLAMPHKPREQSKLGRRRVKSSRKQSNKARTPQKRG
jgi:hypothetical protein